MDIQTRLIKILPNVIKMLLDRGYDISSLPSLHYTNLVKFKIENFLQKEDDSSRILDIYVDEGEIKDYVFFSKDANQNTKLNKLFFKRIEKITEGLELNYGLNKRVDNITFVLVDKTFSPAERENIYNFESRHPNICIFTYSKFLFNISDHILVPKHNKYKKSYQELLDKLMIDSLDRLPYILYNDPMRRHLNMRDNEVVEINRKTLGKEVTVYRICKNFNYLHMAINKIEIDNPQEEESETEAKKQESKNMSEGKTTKKDVSLKIKLNIKPPGISWNIATNILFWSSSGKSNKDWQNLRYLSNFHKIEDGQLDIDDVSYSTIEHYFQAQKYNPEYHTTEDVSELEKTKNKFKLGGEFDTSTKVTLDNKWGVLAKSKGGKTYMTKTAKLITFNSDKWNSDRIDIMKKGISARVSSDDKFKTILKKYKSENKKFFHYERVNDSFWGGKVKEGEWMGQNILGKILDDIVLI